MDPQFIIIFFLHPDSAAGKFVLREPKAQAIFLSKSYQNWRWEKYMAQLVKDVGNRQYRV